MTRLSNLERRIARLERERRQRRFQRALKTCIRVVILLLLLWLLMDVIHLHMALDAMRDMVNVDGQSIAGLHKQVDSVQQAVNGIRVKINGMDIAGGTHITHSVAHSATGNVHSSRLNIPSGIGTAVGALGVLGAIGGVLASAAKMIPVIG